jgi:hypothetical protein
MNRSLIVLTATLWTVTSGFSLSVFGQDQSKLPLTFFVTSVGMGNGGNLGGLEGADKHCQMLAQAAGSPPTRTWHAYLSTQASGNQPAVNARDRIGTGPWVNADGAEVAPNLNDLHGDAGQGSIFNRTVGLTERGRVVDGSKHDILTGSQTNGRAYTDGMDHTCSSWMSNGAGSAQVGHHDRTRGGPGGGEFGAASGNLSDRGTASWNSSHGTMGCSQDNLAATGAGAGLFYCFAVN